MRNPNHSAERSNSCPMSLGKFLWVLSVDRSKKFFTYSLRCGWIEYLGRIRFFHSPNMCIMANKISFLWERASPVNERYRKKKLLSIYLPFTFWIKKEWLFICDQLSISIRYIAKLDIEYHQICQPFFYGSLVKKRGLIKNSKL